MSQSFVHLSKILKSLQKRLLRRRPSFTWRIYMTFLIMEVDLRKVRSYILLSSPLFGWGSYKCPSTVDYAAIRALATGLKGTNKPLVSTSGIPSPGIRICTELDIGKYGPRAEAENILFEYTSQGVRTAVVRLPFTVHGDSDKAFIPQIISQSRQKGNAAYVGEGGNRWPAVHVKDAAQLFRAVIESKTLKGGKILHGVQDEGIPFKRIAEVVGKKLGVEPKSVADEEIGEYYTWLGMFVKMDFIGSSKLTREWLGWEPKEKGLLADLESSQTYFKV